MGLYRWERLDLAEKQGKSTTCAKNLGVTLETMLQKKWAHLSFNLVRPGSRMEMGTGSALASSLSRVRPLGNGFFVCYSPPIRVCQQHVAGHLGPFLASVFYLGSSKSYSWKFTSFLISTCNCSLGPDRWTFSITPKILISQCKHRIICYNTMIKYLWGWLKWRGEGSLAIRHSSAETHIGALRQPEFCLCLLGSA